VPGSPVVALLLHYHHLERRKRRWRRLARYRLQFVRYPRWRERHSPRHLEFVEVFVVFDFLRFHHL